MNRNAANADVQDEVLIAGIPDALAIFDAKGFLISFTKEAGGVLAYNLPAKL